MENLCFVCGKNTKYQCIRCPVVVCAVCAPETPQTEKEEAYTPMRHVGICRNCGDSSEHAEAQSKDEIPSTSTSGMQKGDGNTSSAHKRKQWTQEQKLEFIDLYKKFNNQAKAAREFQVRYKFELKSSTYNPWLAQEKKIREASFKSRKVGSGRKAAYPEMEKRLYEEFKILCEKGVKEWWFRTKCKSLMEMIKVCTSHMHNDLSKKVLYLYVYRTKSL